MREDPSWQVDGGGSRRSGLRHVSAFCTLLAAVLSSRHLVAHPSPVAGTDEGAASPEPLGDSASTEALKYQTEVPFTFTRVVGFLTVAPVGYGKFEDSSGYDAFVRGSGAFEYRRGRWLTSMSLGGRLQARRPLAAELAVALHGDDKESLLGAKLGTTINRRGEIGFLAALGWPGLDVEVQTRGPKRWADVSIIVEIVLPLVRSYVW